MLKKLFRGLIVAALSLAAYYSPIKPQNTEEKPEITYIVEKGDYLSKIASERLETDSLSLIIEETNKISNLNNKGNVENFPWHEDYDCSTATQEDPNCIYPGESIILEPSTSTKKGETDYTPLVLAGMAGIIGMGFGRAKPPLSLPDLERIVEIKNNNPYASIETLVEKSHVKDEEELKQKYKQHFEAYGAGETDVKFARYDANIAPPDMKSEMVERYQNSKKTLKQIANDLSEEYGMNVSSSTISKYARKELGVKNRKEAKAL